jgi:hypothetical protein
MGAAWRGLGLLTPDEAGATPTAPQDGCWVAPSPSRRSSSCNGSTICGWPFPDRLATAGHQAFSANLLTLPSDLVPRSAVGSVVGIGGMAGAVGGMLIAKFVGAVLAASGSYAPIFLVAGSAYFLALLALHLPQPRLAPLPVLEDRL